MGFAIPAAALALFGAYLKRKADEEQLARNQQFAQDIISRFAGTQPPSTEPTAPAIPPSPESMPNIFEGMAPGAPRPTVPEIPAGVTTTAMPPAARGRITEQPIAPNEPFTPAPPPAPASAPARARPAAALPGPAPAFKPSFNIDLETAKMRMNLAPTTAEDQRKEASALTNTMLQRGYSPKQVFGELSRRNLPVTMEERQKINEDFFRLTMNTSMAAIYAGLVKQHGLEYAQQVPPGAVQALAAHNAGLEVGQEYMPDDVRKQLMSDASLPPDYKIALQAMRVIPGFQTSEQLAQARQQIEVDIPAERAAEIARQTGEVEREQAGKKRITPQEAASMELPFGVTQDEAASVRRMPLTEGARNTVITMRSARAIAETQIKPLIDRLFKPGGFITRLSRTPANMRNLLIQSDPDVADYERVRQIYLAAFSRSLGQERGQTTEFDVGRAEKNFPKLFPVPDSYALAQRSLRRLIELPREIERRAREEGLEGLPESMTRPTAQSTPAVPSNPTPNVSRETSPTGQAGRPTAASPESTEKVLGRATPEARAMWERLQQKMRQQP